MWRKQIPSLQSIAAFILLFVTDQLFQYDSFNNYAFAAPTEVESCAANDPREECINPNTGFDSEDDDDDDDDGDDSLQCKDEESSCKYWSRNGECERNPGKKLAVLKQSQIRLLIL